MEFGENLSPVERARWLAQLALAVEQGQALATQLGSAAEKRKEAQQLFEQLEALRIEIDGLRGLRGPDRPEQNDPFRMKALDWLPPRTGSA